MCIRDRVLLGQTLIDCFSFDSSTTKTAQLFGVTYAISVSIQYFAFAAAFAYGSQLVASGEMEFYYIFR